MSVTQTGKRAWAVRPGQVFLQQHLVQVGLAIHIGVLVGAVVV